MRSDVSLTMIVKDEESNLAACLQSVSDLVGELVIVDTGSVDRTREIALEFGARVYDFHWIDDFSAARNEALDHARGRWILWLDADERFDADGRRRLARLLESLGDERAGYIMKQVCLRQSTLTGPIRHDDKVVPQVRLFPRTPEYRWEHRVYEQISLSIRRAGGELRETDIEIQHPGYEDPSLHRRKIERNLRLARMESLERPVDPYVQYTLGLFLEMLGDDEAALGPLRRALGLVGVGASYGPTLFAMTAQALLRTAGPHEALAVCRAGRERYPENEELRGQEAYLLPDAHDLPGGEALLRRLATRPGIYPASLEADLSRYARHHLAILCRSLRRYSDAEAHWRDLLDEAPGFARGWLELGELYLSTGRWPDLERVARHVDAHLGRSEDAAVLRSRGMLARREFHQARELLLRLIKVVPRSLRPRQALSHVLLLEGRDPAAAEQALLDVLAIEPNDTQAARNLEILRDRLRDRRRTVIMAEGAESRG